MEYGLDKSQNMHALNVIQEFMAFHGLHHALHDMEQLIYYAVHRKYFKKSSPYNIVFFAAWLRRLLTACIVLQQENGLSQSFAVDPGEKDMPDLNRIADYMPSYATIHWNFLPRHLTAKQYLDPMKVFRQLKKYKTEENWMKTIDELMEYSLSNTSIDRCEPPYNIMKLRRVLLQMIEACHLIVLRHEAKLKTENG